ncbi:MAG: trypsin-like serine protease [Deltaproteobacteria bacterium]|nr:trypsin-like serine protease [Deltaproteobacteria bacterium]
MKTNILRRTSLIFTISATLSGFGCDGASPQTPATPDDPEAQELIGGFPAGDKRLDFVGALVAYDPRSPYSPPEAFCSGSLVGAESVMTAKHCAQILDQISYYGLKAGFAVGSNSAAPSRIIPIVEYDQAPGDIGGFVGMGQDVAVVHLESPVTDIAPVVPKTLTEKQIGQKMVAIGYGVMNNAGQSGQRRVGTQTVKAVEGRVFEALFGNFDKFYAWFTSQGYYSGTLDSSDARPPMPTPTDAGGSVADGGVAVDGGGGINDGGFPPYDPTAFARYIYDSTLLLSGYEAVTGGQPGDAQPCYGDSGSPLIRYNAKTANYEAWGVVSGGVGSSKSVCDFGTVYATFGTEVLAYVKASAKWTDPCKDLTDAGSCVGNVASRCTGIGEGARRISALDCDLLGLQCQATPVGVACGDTVLAPPPAPKGDPKKAPDFSALANKSFSVK